MRPLNHKIGIALLGAVAVLAATANANVVTDDSVPTVKVKYRESDLTQPGGAEHLYRRIEGAARHVCNKPDMREITAYAEFQRCFQNAVDQAVAKVNVTELTAYHHSKAQRNAAG